MKVFISYGGAVDQVTALRLQALSVVNGITVYVPPAHTRARNYLGIDPESEKQLRDSEVVLGVVAAELTEACLQELNLGISLQKQMMIMAAPWLASHFQPSFGNNLIVVDSNHPGEVEAQIVAHLRNISAQQASTKALVALGTLALALLLFAATKERA